MAAEGPAEPPASSPGRSGGGALGGENGGSNGDAQAPTPEPPPPAPPTSADPPLPPTPSPSCNGAAAASSSSAPPEPQAPPPAAPEEPPPPREPEAAAAAAAAPPPEEPPASYPPEFERLWLAAQGNPHDFGAWTELLQFVEQENHLGAARRAFDAFFSHYPYCYGYWKKYADMERRFHCPRQAEEVFERGLQSIPLSMDLWIHYISYLQSTLDPALPDSIQKIRGVFEAAVAAAGMDFRSDKLWELYVEWERERGDLRAVTGIYDRLLSMPTQLYSHHWEKFKEHVLHHPPKEILSPEELLWVQSKLAADPIPKPPEPSGTEAPPGEDPPPGMEGKAGATSAQEELDQEKIRELVISMRQQIYAQNEAEVSKRWNFEDGIKRPYFHVKPLERAQLRNWRDYLDFEMASGSHERTIVLFERCLIACALYEEFWVKYTRYLSGQTVAGTRSVFQRACGYHLPRKPTIHLLWAAFEEKQGNVEESRRILRSFEEVVPGLAMVRLRRVSLERRQGNLEEAERLLHEAMVANEGLPLASFYAVKLARQMLKVQKNLGKARKILTDALEKEPDNPRLHANLLELELGVPDVAPADGQALRCLERALRSPLSPEAKILFSQRRLEFLEDYGSSIHSLLTAYDDHQRILKQQAARKRIPENGSEDPEDKRLRLDDGSSSLLGGGSLHFGSDLGGAGGTNPSSYNYWYQQGYGTYGYQSPWNYNQYYGQS